MMASGISAAGVVDLFFPRLARFPSAGGNDDEKNLVTCCVSCNSRKGNLSIEEFLRDLHTTVWPVAPALRDAEQRDGRA
jgi:5-methylcytosine-specific restriction endonuclease McrA